jgi:hypothetical protein
VTAWERLSALPPLRDATGTILLEEVDDDTRTATFRVYGRSSLTATLTPSGEFVFDADPPPALLSALSPRSNPQPPSRGSDPVEGRRGLWAAAWVACGIAAIAARRRR